MLGIKGWRDDGELESRVAGAAAPTLHAYHGTESKIRNLWEGRVEISASRSRAVCLRTLKLANADDRRIYSCLFESSLDERRRIWRCGIKFKGLPG